jgi:pilus assembly protein CpaC
MIVPLLSSLSLLATPDLVASRETNAPIGIQVASRDQATQSASMSQRYTVAVGHQTVLKFPGMTKIALGNPGVADVHVQGDGETILTGKSEGRTTLIVWRHDSMQHYDIEVNNGHTKELSLQIHALPGTEDLRVTEMAGKTLVEGTVPTQGTLDALHTLLDGEGSVVFLVDVDRAARKVTVDQINNALGKAGFRNARASLVGGRIFLEGQVDSEADLQRAQLIADSIVAEVEKAR